MGQGFNPQNSYPPSPAPLESLIPGIHLQSVHPRYLTSPICIYTPVHPQAFHAHHARLTRLSKPQSQNHNHNHALTTTRLRHAITRRLGTSDSHPKVDELMYVRYIVHTRGNPVAYMYIPWYAHVLTMSLTVTNSHPPRAHGPKRSRAIRAAPCLPALAPLQGRIWRRGGHRM